MLWTEYFTETIGYQIKMKACEWKLFKSIDIKTITIEKWTTDASRLKDWSLTARVADSYNSEWQDSRV